MSHRRTRILISVAAALFVCAAAAAAQPAPHVFTTDPQALQRLRADVAAGKAGGPALQKLRADADRALRLVPLSVTQKEVAPPSGDKHDYMSLAPYFWPDPKAPNGPYIRRDGERNSEITRIPDHKNFDTVMYSVQNLGLAYYLFGDERYAAKSAELLRAWFLDPATRMNPNLQFAQGVHGITDGRGIGLIETREIGKIVDGVGLLAGSKSWTQSDQRGLEDWCSKFLAWMQESANGKAEARAKNNHGTYYDVQVVALALFLDKRDLAREVLESARQKRIASEVEPDGRQPLELARTKSFSYSVMNLTGLFALAELGDRAGVDLWSYRSQDGRSIRAALDYLLPFATGEQKWTRQQIEPMKPAGLVPLLLVAAQRYRAPAYRETASRISPDAAFTWQALLLGSQGAAAPQGK